jgi:FlgD Ig-like domain
MTQTMTPTATPSGTATLTPLPTSTPTPGAMFYLSKNRFVPNRENLTLKIGMLSAGEPHVQIFTLSGRRVWEKKYALLPEGYVFIQWDGRNQAGETVAAGVYYIVLEVNGRKTIRKVLLVR